MRGRDRHQLPLELPLQNLTGGLDYSLPPHDLPPHKLVEAENLLYDVDSGRLMSRPGAAKLTTTATPGAKRLAVGVVNGTQRVVVMTSSEMFSLENDTLVKVGDLNNVGDNVRPSVEVFDEKMYIASGGYIQEWDGSSPLADITQAPQANRILAKSARLFANRTDDPDIVQGSDVLDVTTWGGGDTVYFQAGWKNGDIVQGMAALGDDMIIFKGPNVRSLFVLKGVYPNWQMVEVARGTGAVGGDAIGKIGRQVVFMDWDGINALAGVIEYGDLKADPIGGAIVGALSGRLNANAFMVPWPDQSALLCFPNDTLNIAFMLHYASSEYYPQWRWTKLVFNTDRLVHGAYDVVGQRCLFLDSQGHIYEMKKTTRNPVWTDANGDYHQEIRTKVFDPPGANILVKRANIVVEPIDDATVTWSAYENDGSVQRLLATDSWSIQRIGDWDSPVIGDAVKPRLGDVEQGQVLRSKKRLRASNMQFALEITQGAVSLGRISVVAAAVGHE